MHYRKSKTQLEIYHQGLRRRLFVGTLTHELENNRFRLDYDEGYLNSKSAIPLGVELSLTKKVHYSKTGQLFPTFLDRIPSKRNPAYPDYCYSQDINVDEQNFIVLLRTIGRRGPSTFVYEPVFSTESHIPEALIKFREDLSLTRWEMAQAFEISELMLLRIETGRSQDANILRLIEMYLHFPEVSLWLLRRTGKKFHSRTRTRLVVHFEERLENERKSA